MHTTPPQELPAITDAFLRYAEGLDHGDTTLLESALMPDAVVDLGPATRKIGAEFPPLSPRDVVVGTLIAAVGPLDSSHSISNVRAVVDGDTASATCYAQAQHFLPGQGPSPEQTRHALMMNRYTAELVRDGDTWRIQHLSIDSAWFTGDPDVLISQVPAQTSTLAPEDVAELAGRIAGPVLTAADDGYEVESATLNLANPLRPAVVVGATSTADVVAAVRFADAHQMPVAVLGGGHQSFPVAEDTLLISMSRMADVSVDADRAVARVGGGTRWQQVLDQAAEFGLAPLNGSSPSVGVVGYTLGGGSSPVLGRQYGFAADHVLALELVTADGQVQEVTADSDPDLFWAVRGGKGNFGVVTGLQFSLFPVRDIYAGGLFFDGPDAAGVAHAWREWVSALPEHMSSSLGFLRLPPLPSVPAPLQGKFVLHVRFSSTGSPAEAEEVLAPLRAVAETVLDTVTEMPYREMAAVHMDPTDPVPYVERTLALQKLSAATLDALLAQIGHGSAAGLGLVDLRAAGGALGREPQAPNAVAGRQAAYTLTGFGIGAPEDLPELHRQLTALTTSLETWGQKVTSPNYLAADQGRTPHDLRAVYGPERYERLVAVKQLHDPHNLFRVNHNITAAD